MLGNFRQVCVTDENQSGKDHEMKPRKCLGQAWSNRSDRVPSDGDQRLPEEDRNILVWYFIDVA